MTDTNSEHTTSGAHARWALDWVEVLKHLLFSIAIGVVTGFASVILCLCVNWSYSIFQQVTWLVWILPVMGILQLALYRWWKLPGDLTTHRVAIDMRRNKPISWFLAPGILITTCMSILCGGSVGKEAGALQMGSSLGSLVGHPFKLKSVYKANADEPMAGYVASVGMAACFSALFFAPLGAAMFVLEMTRYHKTVFRHVGSIVVACFVAFLISSAIGIGDIIDKVDVPLFDWHVVGQVVVIGVACALAGSVFDSAIHWIHDLTWRISRNLNIWVVVGGLLFAFLVTMCGWDHFTGSGGNILNEALRGSFGPLDFAIKLLLTTICLGFWLKGGEIMPSFCIGGLLGGACVYLTGGDAAFGVAIGVMCFLAAFSRYPFAAILMGCEIFGWGMAPYLIIGVAIAILCGSPVGMYGDGVDRVLRTRWRGTMQRALKQRLSESDQEYAGAIQTASALVGAVKDEVTSTENKTPSPSAPPAANSADPKSGTPDAPGKTDSDTRQR